MLVVSIDYCTAARLCEREAVPSIIIRVEIADQAARNWVSGSHGPVHCVVLHPLEGKLTVHGGSLRRLIVQGEVVA